MKMTGQELLEYSIRSVPEVMDGLPAKERQQLVRELEAIAWQASYVAGLTCALYVGGTTHEQAVEAANKAMNSTRRALGLQRSRILV